MRDTGEWDRHFLPSWDSCSRGGCRDNCEGWKGAPGWVVGRGHAGLPCSAWEKDSLASETQPWQFHHDSGTTLTFFCIETRSHQRNWRWVKVNDSTTTALLGYNKSKSQGKVSYTEEHQLHNCLLVSRCKAGQMIYSINVNVVPAICPCRWAGYYLAWEGHLWQLWQYSHGEAFFFFFCKGPDSKYFMLCGSDHLCCNHSSLPLWCKGRHRPYAYKGGIQVS